MGRCLRIGALINFFGGCLCLTVMSHSHICHNPNCTARFSQTNMSASRRVPELVNIAALDTFYFANPEKAVNRSQDRVCIRCSHQNNCRPPTWLLNHLCVYIFTAVGVACVASHPCFSRLACLFLLVGRAQSARGGDGHESRDGRRAQAARRAQHVWPLFSSACFVSHLFFQHHIV